LINTCGEQHHRNPRFARIERIVQAFTEADAGGNLDIVEPMEVFGTSPMTSLPGT